MQAVPQPQVIVLQAQSSGPSYKEDYAAGTSRILGTIQVNTYRWQEQRLGPWTRFKGLFDCYYWLYVKG